MSGSGAPPFKEWLALSDVYHEVADVIGWPKAVELGAAVWEHKRPPRRERSGKTKSGVGGCIYIPSTLKFNWGHELIGWVGLDDARRLVNAFGGDQLFFPSMECASKERRDRAIADQVRHGSRIALVACAFDLSERQVRRIVKQESIRSGL